MRRIVHRLSFAGVIALANVLLLTGAWLWMSRPRPPPGGGDRTPTVTGPESDPAPPSDEIDPAPGTVTPADPVSLPPTTPGGALPLARGDAGVVFAVSRLDGSPLVAAEVTLLRGRRAQSMRTRDDGTAPFEAIEAGSYSFTLAATGLPPLVSATQIVLERRAVKHLSVTVGDYALAIKGRILDHSGKALEHITVRARRLLDAPKEGDVLRSDQESLVASSGRGGTFEIRGVDAFEHLLRTEPTDAYPAAEKAARGGSHAVEIILDSGESLRVHGRVLTRQGLVLPEASVFPLSDRALAVLSDDAGRYEITLRISSGQNVVILAYAREGYREGRINLRLEEVGAAEAWELDLVLEELGARGEVRGTVTDPDLAPVPGQTVHLQSSSLTTRHEAVTDAAGRFAIADVQVAGDYRLWIYPQSGFQDHAQSPIDVPEAGVDLEVTLERLARGTLRGVMVDQGNVPVPSFTLWVKSLKALGSSMAITGNGAGEFESDGIPEGDLIFETRSEPRLTLRGVRFDAAVAADVRLVIDWGPYTVEGTVQDDAGEAVSGANVVMVWAKSLDGLEASSYRTAVSDASGRFVFAELGAGERKVTVTSPRYIPAQAACDPAAAGVVLRLRLSPRPERPESPQRGPTER